MWKRKKNPRSYTPSKLDSPALFFERLEPKILFSADALSGLVAADPFANDDSASLDLDESVNLLRNAFDTDTDSSSNAENTDSLSLDELGVLLDASSNDAARQEIIFVDANTPDYQQLIDGVKTDPGIDYQVYMLQSDRDGIAQITEILGGFDGVDAIHLVSHGNEAGIQLGNSWLSGESLTDYREVISAWSGALDDDADLLIYGCNLAGGVSGQQLISNLAELTGADVAASDDLTGAATHGGDWELEHHNGQIEATIAFSAELQQNYANILPLTFTVNSLLDTVDINPGDGLAIDAAGNTTLRAAIMEANAFAGADIIELSAGTYTLTIGGVGENLAVQGDLDVLSDITISGAGAATTIIDASGIVGGDRVFHVDSGDSLTMTGVTVQGGNASGAGLNGNGGGIYAEQNTTLKLDSVAVQNNIAATEGGGIYTKGSSATLTDVTIQNNGDAGTNRGGGIFNAGQATSLERVTISGNQANSGGGITNEGEVMSLQNVTISGNSATSNGGAIENVVDGALVPGSLTIVNSTLSGNTAASGNGIYQDATSSLDIQNSILNDGGSNISGGIVNSLGNNIDSDGSAGLAGPGDQVGNPMLDVLADNGGFTQTHALLSGSIAINAGSSIGAPLIDQRGQIRIGSVDIGAYEFTDYGLIWGDVGTDSISIATLDGNHVTDLITGLNDPASVAIDPGAGKVYWANEGTGDIERANLDGSGREVIVSGLAGPIAIDLYLAGGKIYWTDGSGTLLRANLDGSSQESISGSPNLSTGVAVDGPGGMVYWVDDGVGRIKETGLTGLGTGNLVTTNVNNTADVSLDLVNDQIYWTDMLAGQLWRANLDGTGVVNLNVGGTPYGLALDPVGNKWV